jgi:hypothetical protein
MDNPNIPAFQAGMLIFSTGKVIVSKGRMDIMERMNVHYKRQK